ncbi:MAG: hypothetical protein VYE22_36535 [Myxococcota bacterium]|nr:hypothetical protein [Myxococcota bacterium]
MKHAPLAALLLLFTSSTAYASPQDLFGFGGRSPGMAMTGASYVEGYEAVFSNPAGLAPVRTRGLHLGLQGGNFQLSIDGERSPITPGRGIVIGFHLPLPFGDVLEDRLVFGGGFYTPAEVLLRGNVTFPEVPQWTVLDRAQVLAVQVGLGIDLHGLVDGLSLGFGFSALANVFGVLDVRLDETNAFSSVVETQLLTTFAPIVGARYTQPEWGIGLTYRHELVSITDLNIATADLPVMLPVLRVGGVVQYDPPTIIAEGHWKPIPSLMLVANVTTQLWSSFPGMQIGTTAMGTQAPAPEFSPVVVPRVAVEGTHRDGEFTFAFRGGYALQLSPAPPARMANRRLPNGEPTSEQVPFRVLDNDRHILTAGFGWTIHLGPGGEKLVLDAYGQAHVLMDRTHEIGRTAGADPMVTSGYGLVGGWTIGAEF